LLGVSPAGVSNIATVPGRGYSFVAPVERESVRPLLATVPTSMTLSPLPAPLTRMIGRAETLVMFLSLMRKQRLVTIVGPGGMGKTTIALAMAERLGRSFEHHASFVDLSALADPQLLPSALASVLGIPSRSENPLIGLLAFLRDKCMVIVLDSCEHLVEAAAAMVEALLKGAPRRRTAPPRHKTLRATLDWSYGILSADEQVVLKRLAIFCGEFTLDSATAVAASAEVASADVAEIVATLVAKSLLVASLKDGVAWYRLFDTTREYAHAKLLETADCRTVAKLHADTLCKFLLALRAAPGTAVAAELTSTYKRLVDDVRAALRWCFSSDGDSDSESGVRLTGAAAPLFLRLSLVDEYRGHVARVMKDSALMATADRLAQMNLHLAQGHILLHMQTTDSRLTSTFGRALDIAEQVGLAAPRAEALVGAWIASTRSADYLKALEFAERFRRDAAMSGQIDELVYSRMMAVPLHCVGEFSTARHFVERALGHQLRRAQAAHDHLFYVDLEASMYAILARTLWLQGFPDQAGDAADAVWSGRCRSTMRPASSVRWRLRPARLPSGEGTSPKRVG
jgi:predicted ATPase